MKRGVWDLITIGLVFLVSVTLFIVADVWLGTWKSRTKAFENHYDHLLVYAILACTSVFFVIFRDAFYRKKFLDISNFFNSKMIQNIIKSSIGFFMETPANRLVYRLSYDQQIIDDKLSSTIQSGMVSFLFIFGGFLIMNTVYYAFFAIISVLIFFLFHRIVRKYLRVSNDLMEI